LKYGIDAPSSGHDFLARLTFRPRANIQFNLQYKRKEKYKNALSGEDRQAGVWPYEQHRLRYQFNFQPNAKFRLKTQADYNRYIDVTNKQNGWSAIQSVSYTPGKTLQIDVAIAYFDAADWNTRISIYEKNILYAYSFPILYGKGLRYYAVAKWKVAHPVTVYFKIGSTHYFDQNIISSGLEEIEGNEKSDIYFLIKYKF
jgi:hypothetical protein